MCFLICKMWMQIHNVWIFTRITGGNLNCLIQCLIHSRGRRDDSDSVLSLYVLSRYLQLRFPLTVMRRWKMHCMPGSSTSLLLTVTQAQNIPITLQSAANSEKCSSVPFSRSNHSVFALTVRLIPDLLKLLSSLPLQRTLPLYPQIMYTLLAYLEKLFLW